MSVNFEFSIIMAIYNTEKYLEESIYSVINQTLDFESNVQLILVDDGSTDNSKQICRDFQNRFPNNIEVISKENGGQASARNLGLNYATGKYINFLDSDDKLSRNALKTVKRFFSRHSDVDVVALPLIFFDKREGNHNLNYKFEKTRVIDLSKEIEYPQLHISSTFIKRDSMKDHEFNTKLINGEDALLISKIILDKLKYGVISSEQYLYRKRQDESSTMDISANSKRIFTEKIKYFYLNLINYCITKYNHIPDYIQYLIAYDLNGLIENEDFTKIITDKEEIDEFWEYFLETLSYIDEKIIDKHKYLDNNVKAFMIYLKNKDFHIVERPKRNKVFLKSNEYIINKLHNHKIRIDIIEYDPGKLTVSGLYVSNCYTENLEIFAILKNNRNGETREISSKYVEYPTTYRKNIKYLGIDWKFFYNFDVKIDIDENEEYTLKFKVIYTGDNKIDFNAKIKLRDYSELSEYSNYFVKDGKIVLYENDQFQILNYSKKIMLKRELKSILTILTSFENYFLYSIFIRILYYIYSLKLRNKTIWLFIDRPEIADDNAKHLFEYSIKQDDNIDKYFIIDKNSPDYLKMSKISKNIIGFDSIKHKIYYLYSDKIISSHVNHDWLNPLYNHNQKLYAGLTTTRKYFLQHGVTKDDISHWLRKFYHNIHLFVTLSKYEQDSILYGNYNYEAEKVPLLGFPRYDNLSTENSKKEILFIPTWRNYLITKSLFMNSEYFQRMNSFLNNEKLIRFLDENDYKIIFKPHYELVPYLDAFDLPEVVKVDLESSYQELFNSTSLMITDYSSVYFDYAYIKKPIIYYQGDDYHYEKGYFDYDTMGFGEVFENEDDTVEKIIEYINNNCEMEEKYQERVDDFFKYNDKNNCKRVYEWLKEH